MDKQKHKKEESVSRRDFIRKAARIISGMVLALGSISIIRILIPGRKSIDQMLSAGKATTFPYDEFTLLEESSVFIFRNHEGIRAVSAVCTHLGCIIDKSSDGFICPCHGSTYNRRGQVISGAASQNLTWYKVIKNSDGLLFIDISTTVDPEYILKI